MRSKVLLDTDIGSDIDDAVCLAYLLAQPNCELLGITTVTGEAEKRAMMASALCKVAGKQIPIVPGAERPLIVPQKQPAAPQAVALSRWDHDTQFPQQYAIDFLRQTIRKHPGEITLLAIGPLTNVALLFAVDPEIPFLLRSLTLMCGVFAHRFGRAGGHGEWNAICDPHAAAIVYQAGVRAHRSVGLDVTEEVRMNTNQVRDRFHHRLLQPVLDFAEPWFQQRTEIVFHDPLAATTIFDEGICSFQRGNVEVELVSPKSAGMTYWDPDSQDPRHEVALGVDSKRFFDHYFSVFNGGS